MLILGNCLVLALLIFPLIFECRKPVLAGSTVIIHAKLVQTVDRKRYLTATMRSASDNAILAESTSLFILPKDAVASPKI